MAETSWRAQPAGTPTPRVGVRTVEDLQQLAEDAAAPRPRVVMFCSLDEVALEGVTATVRWLLGQRVTAPVSRETDGFPRSDQALGREAARADDAIWGRGPATELHEDYVAAVRHTLRWVMGREDISRPVAVRTA